MSERMLQIQPMYSRRQQWQELAEKRNLFYEAIEFYMPPMIGNDDLIKEAREWYRNSGRAGAIHGAFIDVNPASGDKAFRDLSQRRCRESCELALELGVKRVVLHSSAFPFLRGPYLDNLTRVCAEFYAELAETFNLQICIENSPDLDTVPLREIMKRVDDKRVCVCLDIGHVNYSDVPLEAWFDDLGERIEYMHFSDNNGQFDDHLPLGCGTVNWELADKLWKQLGRDVPITLEVGGVEGVEQSLAYLKQHGYFCGR